MSIHRNLKINQLYISLEESDDFITGVKLSKMAMSHENHASPLLQEAEKQVQAYFSGNLTSFDLPLKPAGTDFQRSVWREAQKIPYGHSLSYGELAERCGSSKKARAVGNALGRNPIPLIIPCHRILASGGMLGGFTGGVDIKRILLGIENIFFAE